MKKYFVLYLLLFLSILQALIVDSRLKPISGEDVSQSQLVFQIETVSQSRMVVLIHKRGGQEVFERALWKGSGTFHEGDQVSGLFKIERFHALTNPGSFFNEKYYLRKKIFWKIKTISLSSLEHRHSFFQELRMSLLEKLKVYSSFHYFAILGFGSSFRDSSFEKITNLGLSHLFVISGLHLGIVFYIFYSLFLKFFSLHRQKTCLVSSLIVTLFYVFLCYPNICLSRAFLMFSFISANIFLERKSSYFSILSLTCTVLLFIDPSLLFDVSFLLSCGALTSLGFSLPLTPKASFFKKLTITCFFIYLGTAPLVFFLFHQISLTGFFMNLICIPLFTYFVMPLFFCALFLLLLKINFCAHLFLLCLDFFFLKFDFVIEKIPPFLLTGFIWHFYEIVIIYIFFYFVLYFFRRKEFRKIFLCFFLLILFFGVNSFLWSFYYRSSKNMAVTFLDVGAGDSIFIQFPHGKTMLIDGGTRLPRYDMGERVLKPYLWWKKIKKIDYLVVTHPDLDHFGGFLSLLSDFDIKEMWIGSLSDEPLYKSLLEKARMKNIPIKLKQKHSKSFSIEGVKIQFHWPESHCHEKKQNNCSLVFSLVYGNSEILLTGDIERQAEQALIPEISRSSSQIKILKVAHHGSKTSSTENFLNAFSPNLAVISSGFRKPNSGVLQRLEFLRTKVYRTDTQGAIELRFSLESPKK